MFFIVSFLFPSLFFYVTSTAIFNEYVPKDKENTAIALVEYSDAKPIINSEEKELKTPLPTSPKPEDFYKWGLTYYRDKKWDLAVQSFKKVLILQPNNADAKLFLAYSYLFGYESQEKLNESADLFRQVLGTNPDYLDAQTGLKRINDITHKPKADVLPEPKINLVKDKEETAESLYKIGLDDYHAKRWDNAISLFTTVLEKEPNNQDARLFLAYSYLFIFQSRNSLFESETLFEQILKAVPSYKDAETGLERTKKLISILDELESRTPKDQTEQKTPPPLAPKSPSATEVLLAAAKNLSDQQNHWGAIQVYQQLIDISPPNSEYLFLMGREYVRLGYHTTAIETYIDALDVKADNSDVLISLGNEYLFFNDPWTALYLFAQTADVSPQDPASWVGLARSSTRLDLPDYVEDYYAEALDVAPEDKDVWTAYGGYLLTERRYEEGLSTYRYLVSLTDDNETYRATLFDTLSYIEPSCFIKGGAAEEKEKDSFTHVWVASLKYWNAEMGILWPPNERYRISARARCSETKQSLLVSNTTQFNYTSVGGSIRGEWFYNPYWTFVTDANMEWINNKGNNNLLPTEHGVKFEPTVTFRYMKTPHTVLFGETTDTIPYRDFTKGHVRVITRETALFSYQRDFSDTRFFGVDLAWLWYQDPIHNQEQDANGWLQVGIPYLEDFFTARYHCEYRHFYHEVSGYYSFQYQLTQWLKLHCIKKWLSGVRFDLEYWHGWRTTRGRNPQQEIIVVPTTPLPVVTVENQIDQIFLTLGYNPTEYCDLSATGSFYHDSFDYTIVAGRLLFDWRF